MTLHTYYGNYVSGIELPEACVRDCSASGPVDDAVAYWAPRIDWDGIPADDIRAELAECGAWDDDDLADDDANLERLLWVAAGRIADEIREGGAA